jgi:outer membrane immunogenic protein
MQGAALTGQRVQTPFWALLGDYMRILTYSAVFSAFLGLSSAASAADMSLKDAPDVPLAAPSLMFSGFYVGGHIGGAWGDVDVTDTYTYVADPTVASSLETSGLMGGVQVGYNFRRGNIVFGIEGDLGGLDLSGDGTTMLEPKSDGDCGRNHSAKCALSGKYSVSGGMYGDLTGRIGLVADRTLFYAKGGLAFLEVDVDSHYVGDNYKHSNSTFDFSHSETMTGWTIGAGVEYALNKNLSLKAEYQHFDFGSASFHDTKTIPVPGGCNGCTSTLTSDTAIDPTVDSVMVGVNYHFQ